MRTLASVLVAAFCTGCAASDLPSRLPNPDQAMDATTGSYVVVYEDAGEDHTVRWAGELIAVDKESLHVLSENGFASLPIAKVERAKLFVTDVPLAPGTAGLWVFIGLLSTASQGYGAIYTAPAWLIVGTVCAGTYASFADSGDMEFPGCSWEKISLFSRFPQGLPPRLDRSRLRVSANINLP
jgi:hypothetical protein